MYDKENFLSWSDDIDLDALLESYTETDDEFSEEELDTKPSKKHKKTNTCPNIYQCPECDKSYKSIAGFRGHVRIKHGITRISVSDHRKGEKAIKKHGFSITEDEFQSLFTDSYKQALESILSSPFRNNSRSKHGPGILAVTQYYLSNQQKYAALAKELSLHFGGIFKQIENNCNTDFSVSEKLFSSFYEMTSCELIQSKLASVVTPDLGNIKFDGVLSAKLFLSVLQDSVLKILISNRAKFYNRKSTMIDSAITDSDQAILYYISGYIISKLEKKTYQHNNHQSQVMRDSIQNFVVSQSSMLQEHVKTFSQWTDKLNRGGLKIPCDNFYFFLRQCELVLRNSIDIKNVTSETLMTTQLKELVVSNFMVQYYWDLVCTNKECSLRIMELCVNLFLTIRGHSLARSVMLRIPTNKMQDQKPLRKVLHDRSGDRNV